jgi:hypothetical protein
VRFLKGSPALHASAPMLMSSPEVGRAVSAFDLVALWRLLPTPPSPPLLRMLKGTPALHLLEGLPALYVSAPTLTSSLDSGRAVSASGLVLLRRLLLTPPFPRLSRMLKGTPALHLLEGLHALCASTPTLMSMLEAVGAAVALNDSSVDSSRVESSAPPAPVPSVTLLRVPPGLLTSVAVPRQPVERSQRDLSP